MSKELASVAGGSYPAGFSPGKADVTAAQPNTRSLRLPKEPAPPPPVANAQRPRLEAEVAQESMDEDDEEANGQSMPASEEGEDLVVIDSEEEPRTVKTSRAQRAAKEHKRRALTKVDKEAIQEADRHPSLLDRVDHGWITRETNIV